VTQITNTTIGVISGYEHAIRTHDAGNILLNNYGTINGNIYCNVPSGTDVIHNHGKIHGVVKLYGASDRFNGSGGTSGAIFTGAGNDRVIVGEGNVKIHVGTGFSTLTAGPGQDQFIFGFPHGATETITNFKHGVDKIVLSEAAFAGLGPHGMLHGAHFHLGAPVNGLAQIDYIPSTDALEYCPAGNAGSVVNFATLTNHAHISASDFILIA
jgi:Ca2+-binding RTX toxin-like protein